MAKTGFWLRGAKGKLASQRLASGGDERRERLSAAGGAGQWWLGWHQHAEQPVSLFFFVLLYAN